MLDTFRGSSSPELWLMLVDIIECIPENSIRHLTVRLASYDQPWMHAWIDWPPLRKVCGRFTELTSLTIARHDDDLASIAPGI